MSAELAMEAGRPWRLHGVRAVLAGLLSALALAFVLKLALASGGAWPGLTVAADVLRGFFNDSVLLYGGAVLAALLIECAFTGWRRSSFRRVLVNPGDSARGDLFFLFFALSGGMAAGATLISLGLMDLAVEALDGYTHTGLLRDAPTLVAAPLLYLAMTFFNYWNHRLLHTPLLWRLHAVHHSAHEFTILNAARVSPMEVAIVTVSQAIPAALLGASAEALQVSSLIAAFEILWTHSNIGGFHWMERVGLSSPSAHVIHHARDARFHDRNFGDLVLLWDQLFGTYVDSRQAPYTLEMGVDTGPEYQSRQPLRDLLRVHLGWLLLPVLALGGGLRRNKGIAAGSKA